MKKLLTVLLATVMCFVNCLSPMIICEATNSLNIRGDINQDGKLNILDLLNMKKCLLGISSDYNINTALQTIPQFDVNADGELSTTDLVSLKRILFGLDDIKYMDNDNTTQISQETETYSSSYLSMTIPKGWKVQEGGLEMTHTLVVYNESNPQYQIFVRLKAEPILKSKDSKDYWQFYNSISNNMYSLFADAPYLEDATISSFYAKFNDFGIWAKAYTNDFSNVNLLSINNFKVVSEYNNTLPSYFDSSNVTDSKTLMASFNDDSGNSCKGLFSGTMVNFGDMIQDMTSINYFFGTSFPSSIDTSFYMVYDMAFITTPSDSFDTDAQFLTNCLNTLEYSSEFVESTNQNIQERTDYFNEVWNK